MDRHGNKLSASTRLPYLGGATLFGVTVAFLAIACGDDGTSAGLLNGRGARNGATASSSGSTPAGPTGSTAIGSGGSSGSGMSGGSSGGGAGGSSGGSSGGVPLNDAGQPMAKAEQLFRALETTLVGACGGPGGGCHVTGAYQNNQTPVWLGNPDAYASIKKYPGIVVGDPYSSKLLVKGPHEGPAFTGPNKALGDQVTAWLTEESLEMQAVQLPSSDPFTVAAGANTVDVSKAGTGITGTKITFTASISGDIVTLSNLSIVAPATTAVHVVHPLFATVANGQTTPDPVDSLSTVDQTVSSGQTAMLGSGTVIFTGIASGAQFQIEFTKIASTTPVDAGTTGGCKSVAMFTANAVPAIQGNQCLNCHGAPGGSGYGSLDLSQVGKNDTLACAQALTKVDLNNKASSDIILAPTGGVGAHPFKNANANYKTMMLNWINNE